MAETEHVLPVKLKLLNQLLVVRVGGLDPEIKEKFMALDAVPPVVPNVMVEVVTIALLNPPVPVQVKLVAFAPLKIVAPAVELVKIIFPEPKSIDLAVVPVKVNTVETVRLLFARLSVPAVKVKPPLIR